MESARKKMAVKPTVMMPHCSLSFSAAAIGLLAAFAISPCSDAASLGTWIERKPATKAAITGVAFGNGTFVAVGDGGYIATSTDGVKWSKRSAGISRKFNGVTFSQGRFIAVCKAPDSGSGAKIWISDDNGAKWKYRDTDAGGDFISQGLHAVAGDGNGNLAAVGGLTGKLTTSSDNGTTWHQRTPPAGAAAYYGVAYGNGQWIAVGTTPARSVDGGVTWTTIAGPLTNAIAYGDGRFVSTGSGGIAWSSNGTTWKPATKATGFSSDSMTYAAGCTYADGLFVVVTEYGDIWTSENGREFKHWRAPGADPWLLCVTFGNRTFLSGGVKGQLCQSPPWLKARLGGTWDHPYTMFDGEESLPRKVGLPEYRVNTSSLNLLLEGTLFSMRTLGVPVNLRLVYNSGATADGADTIGLFGKNWRMHYESVVGNFGTEAQIITSSGRTHLFKTPNGEDLSTATLGSPITLLPPTGVFDELKFYGPGNHFDFRRKDNKTVYRYGVSGGPGGAIWRLTRVTDRNGNAVTLSVDGATGRINTITDPSARAISFSYDIPNNLCTGATLPGGRTVLFSYDAHKNLTGITDMAGYHATYEYDADDLGFLTKMTTAGRVNQFTYAPRPGYETMPPDPSQAAEKCLASVTNAEGGAITYETLPGDAGIKRTDARGTVTVIKSATGQTSQITDPLGAVRSIEYSPAKLPTSFSDEEGKTVGFSYDARGNLTQTTDALGNTTTMTYSGAGHDNLLTLTNALGKTWTYTYDASDRLSTVTTPLSHQTLLTYFANGRLNKVRDARLNETTYTYDGFGNLKTATNAVGNVSTLNYDGSGLRCTSMTDPRGKSKTMTYDPNDRLLMVTYSSAPGTPQRVNTFDAFGQTRFENELHQITRASRNDFGYITAITDPLGNTNSTEYDPDNNPVRLIDALGRTTSFTYDAAGYPLVYTDALGKKITRSYDADGKVLTLTDQRKSTTAFAYDANRRLIETKDALGRLVTFNRDALGRINAIVNGRKQMVILNYNDEGRLLSKSFAYSLTDVRLDSFPTYDAVGNVTRRNDQWGVHDYTYDNADRLTSIQYPTTGVLRRTVGFTYNASGLVATITYPNGLVVTYTYDDFNRQKIPARLRNGSAGELIGAGEKANRVTSLQMSLGGNIRTITYGYDAVGKVTSITRPGTVTTDFSYDGAGRTTRMRHLKSGTEFLDYTFGLDAGGNLLDEDITGSAVSVAPLPDVARAAYDKANQLKSWNGTTCQYDEDGNLVALGDGSFAATYSPENRLLTLERTSGGATTEVTYTYDSDGQRVRRAVTGGATTHYHYGPDGNLLFTSDQNGAVTATYIWVGRALAAILDGASLLTDLHYPHLDRRGSTAALTDVSGNVEARYASQPYGATFASVEPGGLEANPFTFIGGLGVMDEGDGLFYMKQRFYDSKTGRFIQRDPLGFGSTSANLFQYAGNNPINAVDPSGLQYIRLGGERAGDYARDYWAEESIDPNSGTVYHAYATTMGLFASLWTSSTSNYTAGALTLGYGAAAAAGATTPAIVQTTVQGKAIPEIYRLAKITTATHEQIITSYESIEGTLRLLGAFGYFTYAGYSTSNGGDFGQEIAPEEPSAPTPNQEDADE